MNNNDIELEADGKQNSEAGTIWRSRERINRESRTAGKGVGIN